MTRSLFGFLLVVATACQPANKPEAIIATTSGASQPAVDVSPSVAAPSEAELFLVGEDQKTFPEPFQGRWDATVESCNEQYSDMRLTIGETHIKLWESDAAPTSIKGDGINAIAVDAAFSGEGDTWNDRFRMFLIDAGATLMIDDVKRVRCSTKE